VKKVVAPKKWYPAEDIKTPVPSRKNKVHAARLRSSITPGTVLILLAGAARGKRVVFLKQLKSGLLLVTGPYKINGVALRRVNQAYVIATSTKVDVSAVNSNDISDDFFRSYENEKTESKGEFFASSDKKKTVSAAKKAAQVQVDTQLLAAIKKVPQLKAYLNARFSLRNDRVHSMKF